jgi:hypothetical protein
MYLEPLPLPIIIIVIKHHIVKSITPHFKICYDFDLPLIIHWIGLLNFVHCDNDYT